MKKLLFICACGLMALGACNGGENNEVKETAQTTEERFEEMKTLLESYGWSLREDIPLEKQKEMLLSMDIDSLREEIEEFERLTSGELDPIPADKIDSVWHALEKLHEEHQQAAMEYERKLKEE